MGKYRKKPVVVEAMRFEPATLERAHEIAAWAPGVFSIEPRDKGLTLIVPTLEGAMVASPGDYIIRGVKGEFYPCKPDIFAATYEPAGSEPVAGDEVGALKAQVVELEKQLDAAWDAGRDER